jgi:hypothetical protein
VYTPVGLEMNLRSPRMNRLTSGEGNTLDHGGRTELRVGRRYENVGSGHVQCGRVEPVEGNSRVLLRVDFFDGSSHGCGSFDVIRRIRPLVYALHPCLEQ